MEKVVYILGAGFSAYAGLPLMNDFLNKSKDMYFENQEKYKHFNDIFLEINKMHKIKTYYQTNMFNIEELLSLMEMQQKLGESDQLSKNFIDYITDVIKYYSFQKNVFLDKSDILLPKNIVSNNMVVNDYAHFVLSLLNSVLYTKKDDSLREVYIASNNLSTTSYSVITFNYDLILEDILDFFRMNIRNANNLHLPVYKLHGCISDGSIIPPTWSKDINEKTKKVWRNAYSALNDATKIRIIGYSLPVSDSYFRYFLKSSIIKNQRLKEIDIICFDPTGSVKMNYDQFITFEGKRFKNSKVEEYFTTMKDSLPSHSNQVISGQAYSYEMFERNHDYFVTKNT